MNTYIDQVDVTGLKPAELAGKSPPCCSSTCFWLLLHRCLAPSPLPPQMHHGILTPGLMLLTGVILLGSILTASAATAHICDHRPLSTVGVPLSGPWLRQTLIGWLAGCIAPIVFFLAAYSLGDAQVVVVHLDLTTY